MFGSTYNLILKVFLFFSFVEDVPARSVEPGVDLGFQEVIKH